MQFRCATLLASLLCAQGVLCTPEAEAIAGRTDHVAILRRGSLVFEDRAGSYSYDQLKDLYHQHAN